MPHDIVFSEQAHELAATAREIADKYVRPLAAKYDKAQEYNHEAAKAVAEAGLFKTFVPKEYGGHGAGVLALARVTEELARADSGFGVAFAVNALGSFPDHPRWHRGAEAGVAPADRPRREVRRLLPLREVRGL